MSARRACSACGQALGGQFLQAGKLAFHQGCFRCAHCRQLLNQAFTLQQGAIYHVDCYKQKAGLNCHHCGKTLGETWSSFEGKKLHPACYQAHYQPVCVHCGDKISHAFHEDESGRWHVSCYEGVKLEPCAACGGPLKGRILLDPWGQKAHAVHANKATPCCDVCGRIVSQKTSQGGVIFGDGRVSCGICQITEVAEPAQIEKIKAEVIARLQAVGFDYIPTYIAVTLADQKRMNLRLGTHSRANSHGYTKTIEKRLDGRVTREHSIFVLFGLPRLVFMGVLAHELLHVWLNARGLQHWSEKEVEGFCNLATALIYEQDGGALAKILLERMQKDTHPAYGEGYRLMRSRLAKLGWPGLIQAMQQPPSGLKTGLKKLGGFLDRLDKI